MRLSHDYPERFQPYVGVLERLGPGKRNGPDWWTRCPAHEDHTPSLVVSLGADKLLLQCQAGCRTLDVLRAVGLAWKDLYSASEPEKVRPKVVARYDYRDEKGVLLYQVERLEWFAREKRHKRFRQRRPDPAKKGQWVYSLGDVRRVLYRLPELIAADRKKTVLIVEGEKDADAARGIGLVATTAVCGSRATWLDDYSAFLSGRNVAVVPDQDDVGRRHAYEVAGSLVAHDAASVRVCGLPAKDLSAYVEELRRGGAPDVRAIVTACLRESPVWRPRSATG
jgi:putative DNA primase/helicase